MVSDCGVQLSLFQVTALSEVNGMVLQSVFASSAGDTWCLRSVPRTTGVQTKVTAQSCVPPWGCRAKLPASA